MHVIISQPPEEKKEQGKKTKFDPKNQNPNIPSNFLPQKATSQKHTSTNGMYVQRNITSKTLNH
jgi:hypothetical protein